VNNRVPTTSTAELIRELLYNEKSLLNVVEDYTVIPYVVVKNSELAQPVCSLLNNDARLEGNPSFGCLEYHLEVCENLFQFITNHEFGSLYVVNDFPEDVPPAYIIYVKALQHMALKYANFRTQNDLIQLHLDLFKSILPADNKEGPEKIKKMTTYLKGLPYCDIFRQTKNLLHGIFPIRLAVIDGAHRLLSFLSAILEIGVKDDYEKLIGTPIGPNKKLYLKYISAQAGFMFIWPSWDNDPRKNKSYHWKVRFLRGSLILDDSD
jgi:hypothetical protein